MDIATPKGDIRRTHPVDTRKNGVKMVSVPNYEVEVIKQALAGLIGE